MNNPLTRRVFIFLAAHQPAIPGPPDTPRNRLCLAANAFQNAYGGWAEAMNRGKDPRLLCAPCVEVFASLPELWRAVEHAFRAWVKEGA